MREAVAIGAIPRDGLARDRATDRSEVTPLRGVALEERFASLVATYRETALRVAWRLVGSDGAAAEDVVQNAFLKAYAALDRFRGASSLSTWLYSIVVREARSYLRWRAVRLRFTRPTTEVDDETLPARNVPDDPLLRDRIGRALDGLPRTQREVFVLVHVEGLTVAEAAEVVGKALGTTKTHLHRALCRLREELADLYQESQETNHA
jgi:RNA polymerase sigma-70 factor (ECF subfamily)